MRKCLNKVIGIIMLTVLMLTCCIQGNMQTVQASTNASLKKKLQATTSAPIRKFICEDLNGDGKKEAIAITSEYVEEDVYVNAKIWYITDKICTASIYDDYYVLYKEPINLYSVKNTHIFTFQLGVKNPGGANYFYGYTFDKNGPTVLDNIGVELKYLGNNKFVVVDSQYDGDIYGNGHTWNKYYSKWDGKKMVEYGGLRISQAQLKCAENGANILKQIKKKGKVGNIYYRANGLIFVNYQSDDQNYNVALKLKNGKVSYYDQGGYGKTKIEKATRSGVIHKNLTSCVKYPKSFPVK